MIKALVLDVDGVLSDGGIILDDREGEYKRFHARDGVGVKLAMHAGWRVLFCTARASQPARRRAEELGAEWAIGVARKDVYLQGWLEKAGIAWDEVAYMGDDLQDLLVLRKVGWPVAVADAASDVREVARYVTRVPGGHGAVRDAVEHLLEAQGLLDQAKEAFLDRAAGFAVGGAESGGVV